MSVWSGLENGLPTADMSPAELAPTAQTQLQWPKWGEHFETGQAKGLPPDLPAAVELMKFNKAWRFATSTENRREIWDRMLKIHADQVFSIGTVNSVPQPIVVNTQLRNVPEQAVFSWDPGAFFGIYRPDTFWFDGDRRQVTQ
jgi:peptide/nickel transport system substrate-binding protein